MQKAMQKAIQQQQQSAQKTKKKRLIVGNKILNVCMQKNRQLF